MFARLFAVATLAAFVAAQSECSTGDINCCDNVFPAEDAHSVLSQYGINVLAEVTGLAATGCSSTGVVSALNLGSSCTQQPVCCNDNTFNGLISVGCSPINVN